MAVRYARARPALNALFVDELSRSTGRLGRVLDVGCGTGMSSRALALAAESVIGLDPSLPMLAAARAHPRVAYAAGLAEAIPFRPSSFDLVAVGLALHWFDRPRFLAEASRVLVERGWLFVHDTWFASRMKDDPRFAEWARAVYLRRYPTPPRDGRPPLADSPPHGFRLVRRWGIEAEVPLSPRRLAEYLTTQSNVTAGRIRSGESLEEATAWLLAEVTPLFDRPDAVFPFAGSATLLRRSV